MTAPYDHEALWAKTKLFLNKAMDGDLHVRSTSRRSGRQWLSSSSQRRARAHLPVAHRHPDRGRLQRAHRLRPYGGEPVRLTWPHRDGEIWPHPGRSIAGVTAEAGRT